MNRIFEVLVGLVLLCFPIATNAQDINTLSPSSSTLSEEERMDDGILRATGDVQIVRRSEPLIIDTPTAPSDTTIFTDVEVQPSFPGGIEALRNFMMENLHYPEEAIKDSIEGRVFLDFVVEVDGTIQEVNVVKSVHPLLDAEAVRVILAMPQWQPGMHRGEAVRVRWFMPVTFRL